MSKLYSIKSTGIGKASIMDVDLSKRIVTGLYNAFNFVDDGLDVLLEGSCKRTINNSGPQSNAVAKIKHALFHDITRLPGKIQVLDERTVDTTDYGKITGVYFETMMDKSTEGNDTLIKYQEGVYDNHSIGYREIASEKVEKDGQHGNSKKWDNYMQILANPQKAEDAGYFYAVKEIKLYEGSTVGFGMNSLTPYLGIKGKEGITETQLIERIAKLEKAAKIGNLSDDALQAIEIQFEQLKQITSDLYEQLKKGMKTDLSMAYCKSCEKSVMPTESDCCPDCGDSCMQTCDNCGEKMMPTANNSCSKCMQPMKAEESFFARMMKG